MASSMAGRLTDNKPIYRGVIAIRGIKAAMQKREEALKLQRPLPDDRLEIVLEGRKSDQSEAA
jgi:hypothetical protein